MTSFLFCSGGSLVSLLTMLKAAVAFPVLIFQCHLAFISNLRCALFFQSFDLSHLSLYQAAASSSTSSSGPVLPTLTELTSSMYESGMKVSLPFPGAWRVPRFLVSTLALRVFSSGSSLHLSSLSACLPPIPLLTGMT